MSFDEFAKRVAAKTTAAEVSASAAEKIRKPFAEAFVADVYPHWQGPLKTIHDMPGIAGAGMSHVIGFPPGTNANAVLANLGRNDFVLSEVITISTTYGVAAVIVYAFAGDARRGEVVRIPAIVIEGAWTYRPADILRATGPIEELVKLCVADVPSAPGLFGQLLLLALDAKEAAEAERARKLEEMRLKTIAEKAVATKQLAEEAQRQADEAAATAAAKQAEADEAAKAAAETAPKT
jgi:hypothetical protein